MLYLRLDALGERPSFHLGLVVHVGDLEGEFRVNRNRELVGDNRENRVALFKLKNFAISPHCI